MRFSEWIDEFERTMERDVDSIVPCGACTACCTSSQFVHIGPDENDALAHIPAAVRFPAPGLPKGHFVMGYDQRGHCPMLVDGDCSIYDHRPRTCRMYDCRIFAVTGVEPDQPEIATRVHDWQFEIDDRTQWNAVRAAVPAEGPPIERALRALKSSPRPPGSRWPAPRARRGASPRGR